MAEKIRVGALISGSGTNLQAIIEACDTRAIDGKIVFVGSDNPDAYGLQRAERHGIPTFVVDYKSIVRRVKDDPDTTRLPEDVDLAHMMEKQALFRADADPQQTRIFLISRLIAEARLLEEMTAYPFDLLVLAGFMRNLTPYFIDRVNSDPVHPRIMNIHPALLPAFPGVDGYGDTFRYGCKVGGCSVHFIDYGEDSGPIIGQMAFPIEPGDTLERIKEKGLQFEWQLYSECVQLFAEGRLKVVQKTHPMGSGKDRKRSVVEIAPVPVR